jgi:hypothetical protein
MPFTRKAPRKLSNLVITLSALTRANWQVIDEMENHGFWHKKLDDIDVCLAPLGYDCYGWFMPDGHIYIPAVTGANLSDLVTGHPNARGGTASPPPHFSTRSTAAPVAARQSRVSPLNC